LTDFDFALTTDAGQSQNCRSDKLLAHSGCDSTSSISKLTNT